MSHSFNRTIIKAWRHLLLDLDYLSYTDLARAYGVTIPAITSSLNKNKSQKIQRRLLEEAKQKGIPIPKELSSII